MIELNDEARCRLAEYIARVRSALRGCRSVDPAEVERDIREHIENDLSDAPRPVGVASLDPVLDKLGSPTQWIPEEDRAWWWRTLSGLRQGPEDLRLAYLSFGLFVLALLLFTTFPAFHILMLASFLLARATLAFSAEQGEMRAQRWLIYPPLILVYLFLGLLVLLGPVYWVGRVFDFVLRPQPFFGPGRLYRPTIAARWAVLALPTVPLWLVVLGILLRAVPGFFVAVFTPFLARERARRIGKWLIWIGVILVGAGILVGGIVLLAFGFGMGGGFPHGPFIR